MIKSQIPATLSHYLIHYAFTAFITLLLLLLNIMGISRFNGKIVSFWGSFIFKTLGKKIEIKGLENLEGEANRLAVLNHASLYDIPAILTIMPEARFLGRSKLLSIPLFGSILKILGYVPIDPAHLRQSMDALESASRQISGGKSIIMFPEGTRTLTGELNPFKRGFVKILRKTDADLLPITLNGFFDLKSKHSRSVNRHCNLEICIHSPISRKSLIEMNDRDIIDMTKEIIGSAYKGRRKKDV